MLGQPGVEHAEQAAHLALVAVDGRLDLLREVAEEHVRLSHHRADAAHLEHEPLHHQRTALRVGGQQPAGLLGEVDQDRAGLEHCEVAGLAIDDGGDAAVGRNPEELRALLLEPREVDHVHRVGQLELLEGDRDLVAVGGGGGVQVYHLADGP